MTRVIINGKEVDKKDVEHIEIKKESTKRIFAEKVYKEGKKGA